MMAFTGYQVALNSGRSATEEALQQYREQCYALLSQQLVLPSIPSLLIT